MFWELGAALIIVIDAIALFKLLAGTGSPGHKVGWTIGILLFPVLGVLAYFLIGESSADAQLTA